MTTDNLKAVDQTEGPGNAATSITFRVNRAAPKDVGRGILRIDPDDMAKLGCQIGDIVSVRGKRLSYARVLPSYLYDRGLGYVSMDGLLRENAQVGLGDNVAVAKKTASTATSITLSPLTPRAASLSMPQIAQGLEEISCTQGDRVRANCVGIAEADFKVVSAQPPEAVIIDSDTTIKVLEEEASSKPGKLQASYEDIGGLGKQIARIREMIELPLKHPQIFDRLGIEAPKGVLMYGAPGSGKTLIARAVASETDAHFLKINGPEIIHKFYGESEAKLRNIFEEASKRSPTIIFIDEIDAIAGKRTETLGDVEKRVVAQLLALMDGLQSRGQVIVIGATNIPDALDPALRRPGRFDREIMIPAPDREGRLEILQIHTRSMPLAPDVNLEHLSAVSHGFVGADLASLCREAAMNAVREVIPQINLESDELTYKMLSDLDVNMSHFNAALREVEPSAIRDILVETADVSWEQIGGLEEIKQVLMESIDWPLRYPQLFQQLKVKPPKGILLCGPPGTGKTTLAKALAKGCEANFISIKGPALFSKWVGETEKGIREVFRKARHVAPTIVFIDEIDSLAATRSSGSGDSGVSARVISQLLTEMDGLEELKGVVVVAATNRKDVIDPALLRPGRFDFVLELPVPDKQARLEILKIHTIGRPIGKVDLNKLAEKIEGWVGADIESLVNKACVLAIREHLDQGGKAALEVKDKHFQEAMAVMQVNHLE